MSIRLATYLILTASLVGCDSRSDADIRQLSIQDPDERVKALRPLLFRHAGHLQNLVPGDASKESKARMAALISGSEVSPPSLVRMLDRVVKAELPLNRQLRLAAEFTRAYCEGRDLQELERLFAAQGITVDKSNPLSDSPRRSRRHYLVKPLATALSNALAQMPRIELIVRGDPAQEFSDQVESASIALVISTESRMTKEVVEAMSSNSVFRVFYEDVLCASRLGANQQLKLLCASYGRVGWRGTPHNPYGFWVEAAFYRGESKVGEVVVSTSISNLEDSREETLEADSGGTLTPFEFRGSTGFGDK